MIDAVILCNLILGAFVTFIINKMWPIDDVKSVLMQLVTGVFIHMVINNPGYAIGLLTVILFVAVPQTLRKTGNE